MATRQELKAAKAVAVAVFDTIKAAGTRGVPSGHLYAQLASFGCNIDQYTAIITTLKQIGAVKEQYHVLTAVEGVSFG